MGPTHMERARLRLILTQNFRNSFPIVLPGSLLLFRQPLQIFGQARF
jgi:hypothetical protein